MNEIHGSTTNINVVDMVVCICVFIFVYFAICLINTYDLFMIPFRVSMS